METPRPRALKRLEGITAAMFVISLVMVFFYAPTEAVMGQVQRVFYYHVATAWVGMLGFMAAGVAGIAYLRTNDRKWDNFGQSAVEISLVFFFVTIVMGSIWARPIWNTWWTWDIRLTTAAIVELVYAAYLLLRAGIEDPDRRARFGAVYTILGFISVPLTFASIRIVERTIHPVIIGESNPAAEGSMGMTPPMLQTFLFSLLTFTFVFATLLWHRVRLGWLAERVEQLRLKVMG
ncbi:MAG: cytochrome c biogenesis protein CcsA [Anaerolineales bacterium]|nr:cytochrome c biogenesis protein CcsA [Anaerolineales bacterium]